MSDKVCDFIKEYFLSIVLVLQVLKQELKYFESHVVKIKFETFVKVAEYLRTFPELTARVCRFHKKNTS